MTVQPFHRLLGVAVCFRLGDQLLVAGVPLAAATVFGLGEGAIGAVIAAQGAAWLLMSLPAGVTIDRIAPLDGMRRALAVAVLGSLLAAAGLVSASAALFAFGAFIAASATVMGFLAEGASVQRLMAGQALGPANARLQLAQSAAMLIGPAAMGLAVAAGRPLLGFGFALALAVVGYVLAAGFARQEPPPPRERRPVGEIAEGLRFVAGQPLLRGIVACALFWNLAFMMLAAVFVPYALKRLAMDPDAIGLAQAAMGMGSLAAAFAAGFAMTRLAPRVLLFFGPASSTLAALVLQAGPGLGGWPAAALAYGLLGFGPIIWFVCQNTIRQLVTPAGMLGRVGAVIQLAIYGVRSVGALLGGWIAARYGAETALGAIAALFAVSTAVIPLSALSRLSALPRAAGSPA